ncbi:MAG: hypothetical protein R6U17_04560 [Thermoplasmata archaeon]
MACKQTSFQDFVVKELPLEECMSEEERIDFIREHGTDTMKRGLNYVLQGNKYKPKKQEMWEDRLHQGKKMVRQILDKQS